MGILSRSRSPFMNTSPRARCSPKSASEGVATQSGQRLARAWLAFLLAGPGSAPSPRVLPLCGGGERVWPRDPLTEAPEGPHLADPASFLQRPPLWASSVRLPRTVASLAWTPLWASPPLSRRPHPRPQPGGAPSFPFVEIPEEPALPLPPPARNGPLPSGRATSGRPAGDPSNPRLCPGCGPRPSRAGRVLAVGVSSPGPGRPICTRRGVQAPTLRMRARHAGNRITMLINVINRVNSRGIFNVGLRRDGAFPSRCTPPGPRIRGSSAPWGGLSAKMGGGRQSIDRQMSPRPGAGAADPPRPRSPEPAPRAARAPATRWRHCASDPLPPRSGRRPAAGARSLPLDARLRVLEHSSPKPPSSPFGP